MSTAFIETERLILRMPELRDLDAVEAYNATPRSIWTGGPKTKGQSFRAYATAAGHWAFRGFGMFAIVKKDGDGTACGMAGPWWPSDWPEGELSYNIWSEHDEGKGLAFEAATAAYKWCFETLNWNTLVSYVHPDNKRSMALATRLGGVDDTKNSTPPAGYPDTLIYRYPGPKDFA